MLLTFYFILQELIMVNGLGPWFSHEKGTVVIKINKIHNDVRNTLITISAWFRNELIKPQQEHHFI